MIVDGLSHLAAPLLYIIIGQLISSLVASLVFFYVGRWPAITSIRFGGVLFVAWNASVRPLSFGSFILRRIRMVAFVCFVLDLMAWMDAFILHKHPVDQFTILVWLPTYSLTPSSDKNATRLVSCKCLLNGTGVRRRSGEFGSPFSVSLINNPQILILTHYHTCESPFPVA